MLTAAFRSRQIRTLCLPNRRGFVSSVLLSKTYDDKSLAELRQEARRQGLPVSGTKATLITRIQENDKRAALESIASPPVPEARNISTAPVTQAEAAPSPSPPRLLLAFNIPSGYQPTPEPPIQVPFVPDFWASSEVNAKDQAGNKSPAADAPKISLTTLASTHHAGGPTFNLSSADEIEAEAEAAVAPTSSSTPSYPKGILGEMLDDLKIPPELFAPTKDAQTKTIKFKPQVRQLDQEELKGVYVLLGILFGSWVVAGIASPSRGKKSVH